MGNIVTGQVRAVEVKPVSTGRMLLQNITLTFGGLFVVAVVRSWMHLPLW